MSRVIASAAALLFSLLVAAVVHPAAQAAVPPAASAAAADRPAVETVPHRASGATYRNPLRPSITGGRTVDSCADPAVLRGRGEDSRRWYLYCTTDPLDDSETAPDGPPVFHPVPMLVSTDLVSWRYLGDALPQLPSWAAPTAGLWAPDVVYSAATDRYYLTFTVTDTADAVSGEPGCATDSAIGVATSSSPTGPWTVSDAPVITPRRNGPGCDFLWTYDPDVLGDSVGTASVLYYGSYYGGVFGQRVQLTTNGMRVVGEPRRVTVGNRYEGTNVVRRAGWYYLFASATNCCNGPLTGYSVFAGRSRDPLGPFRDREGNSLLAGRVGGTPVLSMNGNRWVGLGHNSVFKDWSGQWWTAYHAVDKNDPYFEGEPGFTKRPVLLDPLTWRGGWPSVRAGRWASDAPAPGPAAQPGQRSRVRQDPVRSHRPGRLLWQESFSSPSLKDRWSWVRQPAPSSYAVAGGRLRLDVQPTDLYEDANSASVLTSPAPRGDFVVETKVAFDVPAEGCCQNFAQVGMVLYGSADAYVKLTHASIWETRQTEWAIEVPEGTPGYGNTVVGPPGTETWLRIVKEERAGSVYLTGYTSQDGKRWVRGGTWEHDALGDALRIGLVAMGAQTPVSLSGRFDHVRVWELR